MSTTTDVTKTQAWGNITDLMSQKSTNSAVAATDALANKDVFLKLMVAQLQHQDPMNPSDGTQFVTQLAQFTQLEQSLGMKQDLDSIRDALVPTPTTQP